MCGTPEDEGAEVEVVATSAEGEVVAEACSWRSRASTGGARSGASHPSQRGASTAGAKEGEDIEAGSRVGADAAGEALGMEESLGLEAGSTLWGAFVLRDFSNERSGARTTLPHW